MPERRQHTRHRTLLGARLIHGPEDASFDGIIRNLSVSGAMMTCDNPTGLPARITVAVPARAMVRDGWIVWRRLDAVGLAFF